MRDQRLPGAGARRVLARAKHHILPGGVGQRIAPPAASLPRARRRARARRRNPSGAHQLARGRVERLARRA